MVSSFTNGVSVTKELRKSLEELRSLADIRLALAGRMAQLLELREAVVKAEDAVARASKQKPSEH